MKPSEIAKILYNENGIIRDVPNVKPAPVKSEANDTACEVCGKPLNPKTSKKVMQDARTGEFCLTKPNHDEYGYQHVGPDCYKKIMAKLKKKENEQYISNHNKSYVALNQRER